MGKLLRLLIVEDSEDDVLLLVRELQREGYQVEFERVETAEAMQSALKQKTWDLILSDYSMPAFNAPQALEVLNASGLDLPFIIISGTIGEETAVAALKAGANDFLVKGKFARLGPAIERELREAETRREHKRAEDQLHYHARLLRHINDAIIATDDQLRITAWNRAAERMYGWSSEEVLGRNISEILRGELTDGQGAEARELLTASITSRDERIYRRKDGRTIYVEANTIALTNGQGKMTGFVSVDRDITERMQAEEKLRLSDQILQRVNALVLVADSEGSIVYVSPAAKAMLGYEPDELLGDNWWKLSRSEPTEAQREKEYLRGAARGEIPIATEAYERSIQDRWGNARWISWVDAAGPEGLLIGVGHDVTERKQAEKLIQRQLKHISGLRAIDVAISSSFDLHLIFDILLQQTISQLGVDAAAVLLFNPEMQMLEYASSQGFRSGVIRTARMRLGEGYAGRAVLERKVIHVPNLMETGGRLAEVLLSAKENLADYYCTPLIVKGEIKGVLEIFNSTVVHRDRDWLDFMGSLAGQAAIAIDNAQLFEKLQRANAELEQRVAKRTAELNGLNLELERANRAKDEFLATMSHELRTPLNSILGLSESLLEQRRGALNEKQQEAVQLVASGGQHLLDLINDILQVSKIEAGKMDIYPDIISVKELCESSLNFIREMATKKFIAVDLVSEPSISTIYADPQRLKQILVNLLSNAVKFTPQKGKITLEVSTNAERDQIHFSVTDNGIGIAPEDLKKLFAPFTQLDSSLARQHAGTGLGLVLVFKMTELHGGSVQVESEVGEGSRFTVVLPWSHSEATEQKPVERGSARMEAAKGSNPIPGDRTVILLADDHESNILVVGDYLQDNGYEIVLAHNGLEAVEKAEKILPGIILMDIQMPEMDGLEAIGRLRKNPRLASTPIIALTALAMPGDRERCLQAGANEYMSKPVSLKMLVKTVGRLLER